MNFAPGAWKYAVVPLLVAPFALIISATAGLVTAAIGVAALAFFRDPDRTPPPTGVVAPCDGNVSVIREEGDRVRLGIFMNVWHVHVVRAPVDATVTDVEHVSGANKPAFSKESDRNERVHVRVVTEDGELPSGDGSSDEGALADEGGLVGDGPAGDDRPLDGESTPADAAVPPNDATITLIAGAFARRIHPYVEADERLDRGQRLGHIAFGSRVDVLFPPPIEIDDLAVELGDSTTAGETVVLEAADSALEVDLGVEEPGRDAESDSSDAA
ncbi:protein sorting system archaetidylserine decarboxylase [Halosolutus gelatinilyticus]|uniref:protein sorting system archaetidylserine decarboxylase n=1 Tax=Halosolutus gelatinilyticus TaxID=2931975 RepID=UPI001FF19C47|nr:protein sorting system archaetidylserine decarboxylase [Halosolutus gelatinilyticus]